MVMNAVEEVAMIGTMTGTMKSTMMLGLLHGRALQPLCGEALLGFNGAARDTPGPGGAETLEEIMAAIGPLYFLDIKDQLLFLAVGICPLACGLSGQL
jgi:hypothetical protein